MMKKALALLFLFFLAACGQNPRDNDNMIITVSVSPFKFFVDEISGGDFIVNVMVVPGADPHIYEPFPDQISKLSRSVGYICNGYLGFESIWLERFVETNSRMKLLTLGNSIEPLIDDSGHDAEHGEGTDPHYWSSPVCAMIIALSVKDFLCDLNSAKMDEYEANYQILLKKIQDLDSNTRVLFAGLEKRSFMIFHPNLGYLARDYKLEEISLELEGKEPSPARLKDLIDVARNKGINTIFVQREYDKKNAEAIAAEIGAEVKIIDPLSEEWLKSTTEIINSLYISLSGENK